MRCGHGYLTASGNVSEHSTGTAVDIAAVNGVPIVGHQGAGSITDITIQRLLTLQGTMKPHQIISLMTYDNADNTFAMGDHADHIHVGWRPLYGQSKQAARRIDSILKPQQWIKLIDRIAEIDNPEVREAPSRFSLKVTKRASQAHRGE
jgi:D-alanyl-D-alanine dipeptidase